jgi:nucleoside-diphosphate-sugar epimerase
MENTMRVIRNCNVCVGGGAGFLGSHLVNELVEERGCNVLVIDNLVSGRREFVHPRAKFIHADITESEEFLYKTFRSHPTMGQIDYVFNYASWPYIPDSFARPLHVFNVNAVGALKVINAAHEAKVKAILQVSSAEIYGDADIYGKGRHAHELFPVTPHSSYGAAKAAIDAMVQIRWREARTPCIALRQFNCVGERETHPYVVPEIISQLHPSSPLQYQTMCDPSDALIAGPFLSRGPRSTIRLGNNSSRDLLYAGDAVKMAIELLEKGEFGEVYNLGSEESIKIYDLAQRIGNIMECGQVEVEEDEIRKRPWEIWHLQSDNSKIYNVIDGRPSVPLDVALARTVKYFRSNNNKWVWEK